jgi:hypothetical protein
MEGSLRVKLMFLEIWRRRMIEESISLRPDPILPATTPVAF